MVSRQLDLDAFFSWLYEDFLRWGEFRPHAPRVIAGGGNKRKRRSLTSLAEEVRALVPIERVMAW